jgi:folate-binding protein YgfZ
MASDTFIWLVSADLAAALHKRLSMFILRTKTKASLVQDLAVVGAWRSASEVQPSASESPIRMTDWQGFQGFALPAARPDSDLVRWIGVGPGEGLQDMPVERLAQWNREELLSAVPRITSAASDLFVPQAINFELVGGVSFTKGCYPGQEVVARSQYLGKMKRRLALGRCAGQVAVAQDVQDAESGAIVGQVVMAQPEIGSAGTQSWIAFEVETAALEQPLRVGEHSITVHPLPYAIPVHTPVQRPKL